jgi:hypothetical protein
LKSQGITDQVNRLIVVDFWNQKFIPVTAQRIFSVHFPGKLQGVLEFHSEAIYTMNYIKISAACYKTIIQERLTSGR